MKRVFDFVAAFCVLVLSSPIWLVAGLAVYLQDGGPILYRQTRTGLNGRNFSILKFRSMVQNAEQLGSFSTSYGDRRITSTGRILRKTSVDELPQLLNVLRGDMSLVGPRPDVPAQRSLYTEAEFNKRNSVRPGITGLAQAKVRSDATPEERKALDLEYVDRQSFGFDLRIILMTIRQVVRKGGN